MPKVSYSLDELKNNFGKIIKRKYSGKVSEVFENFGSQIPAKTIKDLFYGVSECCFPENIGLESKVINKLPKISLLPLLIKFLKLAENGFQHLHDKINSGEYDKYLVGYKDIDDDEKMPIKQWRKANELIIAQIEFEEKLADEYPWMREVEITVKPEITVITETPDWNAKLFSHQQKAIVALKEWSVTDSKTGVLCLPTGAGKTRTAVELIIHELLPKGKKILWLAHRVELINQAISTFIEIGNKYQKKFTIGRFEAGSKKITSPHDVVVASIPTLINDKNKNFPNFKRLKKVNQHVDFIVFDECHHMMAKVWGNLFKLMLTEYNKNGDCKLLGLSATPTRSDLIETSEFWKFFDENMIHEEKILDLIKNGILAKPNFVLIDSKHKPFHATDNDKTFFNKMKSMPIRLANFIANNAERNVAIVKTIKNNLANWSPILVFTVTIDQASQLMSKLTQSGVRTDIVHSKISTTERSAAIERFKKGQISVLVNVSVFTEGTDLPMVKTAIIARPNPSKILFMQMAGRAMRGLKAKGTAECNIVLFTDKIENLPIGKFGETFTQEIEMLREWGLDNPEEDVEIVHEKMNEAQKEAKIETEHNYQENLSIFFDHYVKISQQVSTNLNKYLLM